MTLKTISLISITKSHSLCHTLSACHDWWFSKEFRKLLAGRVWYTDISFLRELSPFSASLPLSPRAFSFLPELSPFSVSLSPFSASFRVSPRAFPYLRELSPFSASFRVSHWQLWATVVFALNLLEGRGVIQGKMILGSRTIKRSNFHVQYSNQRHLKG